MNSIAMSRANARRNLVLFGAALSEFRTLSGILGIVSPHFEHFYLEADKLSLCFGLLLCKIGRVQKHNHSFTNRKPSINAIYITPDF
ncbi:MAG: hypothetical protein FWF50_02950 [Defluviitaleaceae bacterium]|nr:hypothetical protein [Defluviitaleaceae bacterium]